jgi:hypothetical protein
MSSTATVPAIPSRFDRMLFKAFSDYLDHKKLENTIRVQGPAIQQHLGFLFDDYAARLIEVRTGLALEIRIEFTNVALWYGKHRGEVDVLVAPIQHPAANQQLFEVLHFLSGDKVAPLRFSGLPDLAVRLRPLAATLSERFAPGNYAAFRAEYDRFEERHWRPAWR